MSAEGNGEARGKSDEGFDDLLKRLEKHIKNERQKCAKNPEGFTRADRCVLRHEIGTGIGLYDAHQFKSRLAQTYTVHELAEPLARVIELLKNDANYPDLLVAIGAPALLTISPDQQSVLRAEARFADLVHDLETIAAGLPQRAQDADRIRAWGFEDYWPAAKSPGKGRPPAKDLKRLVESLAVYWTKATGAPFKQDWHKDKTEWRPVTNATAFVHDVVSFVDRGRLPSLRKITEDIVARRSSSSGK